MYLTAFTSPKDPRAPLSNDDRIVVYGGRLFAVIDGVTAKKGAPLADGSSRGQAAGVLIERSLRQLVDDGEALSASTAEVLARVTHTIAAEYARLDVIEEAADPHLRFAAQLAAAFFDGEAWRLLVVGDCAVRLDGHEVIATPNRGDAVIALLRAAVFTAARRLLATVDAAGSDDAAGITDRALAVARAYTVHGSGAFLDEYEDALPEDAYRACTARAEARAVERFAELPPALVRDTIRNGLLGIGKHRNTEGPLGAPCIDGTPVPLSLVLDRTLPARDVSTVELFSDGYFGAPAAGQVRIEAWEAHLAHVESVDPFKVDGYPSTKGSSSGCYTDDRSVLVIAREQPHQEATR